MTATVYDYFHPPQGPVTDCSDDPPITKQSFKDECDINQIMKRYEMTGSIDPVLLEQREAAFADFTGIEDFHTMQNRILSAEKMFATLPAPLRSRWNNQAAELVEWLANPDNIDEAAKLGIIPGESPVVSNSESAPSSAPASTAPSSEPQTGKAG
jgi:hypothetical protein